MKKLFLILTLTASFVFAGPCCFCGKCKKKQETTPVKPAPSVPVSNEPMVFRDEPLVFRDKPVVAPQPVNTHVEEPIEEPVKEDNEYDECVAECKANNVSSSVIDFCIRENCGRLK
jgi:hypothetical protein